MLAVVTLNPCSRSQYSLQIQSIEITYTMCPGSFLSSKRGHLWEAQHHAIYKEPRENCWSSLAASYNQHSTDVQDPICVMQPVMSITIHNLVHNPAILDLFASARMDLSSPKEERKWKPGGWTTQQQLLGYGFACPSIPSRMDTDAWWPIARKRVSQTEDPKTDSRCWWHLIFQPLHPPCSILAEWWEE